MNFVIVNITFEIKYDQREKCDDQQLRNDLAQNGTFPDKQHFQPIGSFSNNHCKINYKSSILDLSKKHINLQNSLMKPKF